MNLALAEYNKGKSDRVQEILKLGYEAETEKDIFDDEVYIKTFESQDIQEIRDICLSTADSGHDAHHLYNQHEETAFDLSWRS